MRKVSETLAGKWFLGEEENKYKLYTGTIPKKVILSLSKLSNDELYSLSQEICWNSYWKRFQLLKIENNDSYDENSEIEEDAFEKYLSEYQREYFEYFDNEEHMVKEVSIKLKSLLDTIIFWAEGFFKIEDDFDLFEVAEQRVMIDLAPSIKKRKKIKNIKKNEEKLDDKTHISYDEEKSCLELIIEAIRNKDFKKAQDIYYEIKKIRERLD